MIITSLQLGKATQMIYILDDQTQELKRVAESDIDHLVSNLVGLAHGNNEHVIRLESGPVNYLLELQREIIELGNVTFSDYPIIVEVGPPSM